ncbi:MAG: hypothetical protein FJ294_13545, partial [Planctomycetes bacterium]|nr:hypothetical protein [Planctomycetota bacterium]
MAVDRGPPLAQVFAAVFPDLAAQTRARVMERSVEESHVHLACVYATVDEHFDAQARSATRADLVPCLERRAAWIERALSPWLGRGAAPLGITGPSGSGKTLFARDCACADHLAHAFDLATPRRRRARAPSPRRGHLARPLWAPPMPAAATVLLAAP